MPTTPLVRRVRPMPEAVWAPAGRGSVAWTICAAEPRVSTRAPRRTRSPQGARGERRRASTGAPRRPRRRPRARRSPSASRATPSPQRGAVAGFRHRVRPHAYARRSSDRHHVNVRSLTPCLRAIPRASPVAASSPTRSAHHFAVCLMPAVDPYLCTNAPRCRPFVARTVTLHGPTLLSSGLIDDRRTPALRRRGSLDCSSVTRC
jgi:hypothetical protein